MSICARQVCSAIEIKAKQKHTCDKAVLGGDGRQVVVVDVAIELKNPCSLERHKVRERH